MPEGHEFRSLQRRRVYLGEGLRFEVLRRDQRLDAEAIDLTSEGLGLAITDGDAEVVRGDAQRLARERGEALGVISGSRGAR